MGVGGNLFGSINRLLPPTGGGGVAMGGIAIGGILTMLYWVLLLAFLVITAVLIWRGLIQRHQVKQGAIVAAAVVGLASVLLCALLAAQSISGVLMMLREAPELQMVAIGILLGYLLGLLMAVPAVLLLRSGAQPKLALMAQWIQIGLALGRAVTLLMTRGIPQACILLAAAAGAAAVGVLALQSSRK